MKIAKSLNNFNTYDIKLVEEKENSPDNELLIYMSFNGDLYMAITNNVKLNPDEDGYRWIDIEKDDMEIYSIFDELYKDIIDKSKYNKDILDEDNNIIWCSDEGRIEVEDKLIIFQYEDYYRLIFYRNNRHKEECPRRKSSRSIDIRFATSGSRYKEFVSSFMNMYLELNDIDRPKTYKKVD